jgi:hypothetical protein
MMSWELADKVMFFAFVVPMGLIVWCFLAIIIKFLVKGD